MNLDLRLGSYADVLTDQVNSIDLIFTSPPYNIGSKAPRSDGRRKSGQYDPKSYGGITGYADALPEDVYQNQQIDFLKWCVTALKEDGVLVYNHKPRRKNGVMIHPMQWLLQVPDLVLMEEIIWDRRSTHNHANRLFWPTTERLYVFKKAEAPYRFINRAELDFRDDHWEIPLSARGAFQRGHACPFSNVLTRNVICAFTREGDTVCDPYSGSGTTAGVSIAIERNFVGSELSPVYYAQSLERLAAVQTAVLK